MAQQQKSQIQTNAPQNINKNIPKNVNKITDNNNSHHHHINQRPTMLNDLILPNNQIVQRHSAGYANSSISPHSNHKPHMLRDQGRMTPQMACDQGHMTPQMARDQERMASQMARDQGHMTPQMARDQERIVPQMVRDQERMVPQMARDQERMAPQMSRDQERMVPQMARDQERMVPQMARDQERMVPQMSRDQERMAPQMARDQERMAPQMARDQERMVPQIARDQGHIIPQMARDHMTPKMARDHMTPQMTRDQVYMTPQMARDQVNTTPQMARDQGYMTPQMARDQGYMTPQMARDQGYMTPQMAHMSRDLGHRTPITDVGPMSSYANQSAHVSNSYILPTTKKLISPVTLAHVTSGDSITIETSQQPPPSPSPPEFYREVYTGYTAQPTEYHDLQGAYTVYQPQDLTLDTVDRTSIAESGDSGLSGTPENFFSESSGQMHHPYTQIGYPPNYRPTNQIDYRQHAAAQRVRSSYMPLNPTQIDFSCKIQLKPSETSFGVKIGDNCLIEKIDRTSPASKEDLEVGDCVMSINGRVIEDLTSVEIAEFVSEAARHRSITFGLKRLMRTPQQLQRTYTLDLPMGMPSPVQNIALPGYIHSANTPMTRYLSLHQLPPSAVPMLDDSAYGCRHSWPHAPQHIIQQQINADGDMVSMIPPPHFLKSFIGNRSNPTPDMNEQSSSVLTPIQEMPTMPYSLYDTLHQALDTIVKLTEKYGMELEENQLTVLHQFLNDPNLVQAYTICQKLRKSTETLQCSSNSAPVITNTTHLLTDCIKDLHNQLQLNNNNHNNNDNNNNNNNSNNNNNNNNANKNDIYKELIEILSSISIIHILIAHDRVANSNYFVTFPSSLFPRGSLSPVGSPQISPAGSFHAGRNASLISDNMLNKDCTTTTTTTGDGGTHDRTNSLVSSLICHPHSRQTSSLSSGMLRIHSRTSYGTKGKNARIVVVQKTNKNLGITLNRVGDSVLIGALLKHSDAEKSSFLHPNDEILEINGVPMIGKTQEQVMNFMINQTTLYLAFVIVPSVIIDSKIIYVRAFFTFDPALHAEKNIFIGLALPFKKGDILQLLSHEDSEWWQAKHLDDSSEAIPGLIPTRHNYSNESEVKPGEANSKSNSLGGANAASSKKIRLWSKAKKKGKKSVQQSNSNNLTDTVAYEEVSLMLPNQVKPRPMMIVGSLDVVNKRVVEIVLERYPHIFTRPIFHTTRPPKSYEKKGIEFHFTSRKTFDQSAAQKQILDPWEIGGHLYGVSPQSIQAVVESGKNCIQILKPESMRYIRNFTNLMPYVIFLSAPQPDQLKEQLKITQKGPFRRVRSDQGPRDKQIMSIIQESQCIEQEYAAYFDETVVNTGYEATAHHIYQIAARLSKEPQWVPISWKKNINHTSNN